MSVIFLVSISTNVSLPIFICDNKFSWFIMFSFFGQIGILHYVYDLMFANPAKNTAITCTFNV